MSTEHFKKGIDHGSQGGSTPSFPPHFPVDFSSSHPRFSSSPLCSAVGPCAVPTLSTQSYIFLKRIQAATHSAPIRDRGAWRDVWSTSCRENINLSYQTGRTRFLRTNRRAAWGSALLMCHCCTTCLGMRAIIATGRFASEYHIPSRASFPQGPLVLPVPRGEQFGAVRYCCSAIFRLRAIVALTGFFRLKV